MYKTVFNRRNRLYLPQTKATSTDFWNNEVWILGTLYFKPLTHLTFKTRKYKFNCVLTEWMYKTVFYWKQKMEHMLINVREKRTINP
jgi:hypothetical protein